MSATSIEQAFLLFSETSAFWSSTFHYRNFFSLQVRFSVVLDIFEGEYEKVTEAVGFGDFGFLQIDFFGFQCL